MKKVKAKKKPASKKNDPKPISEDRDLRLDYGGLPERDLKKGLGCG